MRIALLSTCAVPVPPPAYGGTELFVGTLAKALVERGHEVLVYATGDSRPAGALRHCFPCAIWPPDYQAEIRHASWAWRDLRALRADAVHVNSPEALLSWGGTGPPPVVTIHHNREEHLMGTYQRSCGARLVAISRRQAELLPELGALPVIHHGLDPASYPAGSGGGGYCVFLGRIAPEKAPHLAIDAARKAGIPLLIGGPHWTGEPYFDEYFEREMTPRLKRPGVRWPGELNQAAKLCVVQEAEALLVPLAWEEPFGLVMIEAMLVGTPVVAFARGSAPEVVEHGVTGLLVSDADSMAGALDRARRLDRARCRRRAVERFSASRMAAEYEALYETTRPLAQLAERPASL
jgi:glycosyltransferase involved in cell wall biosynthesis